ncbi:MULTISPECIES: Ig-like domain-containing protein [unclassified Rhodanobacter]|uniref:Ig-like domain-containing protein n=1 Tax=unclassified Rhodanobacter TaxID=2621553 RepID=UPI00203270AC|nr:MULTISPECIES: Ig-like domain-containing protein [unclassified Rhodanobacter]
MIRLQLDKAPGGAARRSRKDGPGGSGSSAARHVGLSALLLTAGLLAGCGGGGKDKTVSTPPTVTSTVPASGSTSALNTAAVSATFDRAMDAASLTAGTFTLACPAGTPVEGAVAYDAASRKATLTPTAMLPADTSCTATLSTGVKDSMGVALASAFTWSFSTTVDPAVVASGMQIFRYDTFGDETQWTDALHMNDVISAAVDPTTALAVGLKVDAEALPASVVAGIQDGSISLTSTDTTIALLKLDAVVGVKGTVETVNGKDTLTRVGITCALCHSTVDNSFAPGIGKRLDGWPNRDLNPGLIISLSPALTAAQKAVYSSWGKGMYDPRYNFDGINGPQVISPAFGLAGIHSITATGDGSDIAYWNRYVGVTQMGGHGTFTEPRTGVNVTNGTDDLISSKLPALQAYQLTLAAPAAPAGSFDAAAAQRGAALFNGAAGCVTCHSGPEFTDANTRLHAPSEVASEPEPNGVPSYASRTATKQYRTAPLKGVWQHPPYFHNGSAATLKDVVIAYNTKKSLGLSAGDVDDLAEYLKSL